MKIKKGVLVSKRLPRARLGFSNVSMDIQVAPVLQSLTTSYPEHANSFSELFAMYEQKLWHQLTERIQCLIILAPEVSLPLLQGFVLGKWDHRMNRAALTSLSIAASRQLQGEEAISLLSGIEGRLLKDLEKDDSSLVRIRMQLASLRLSSGDLQAVKESLDACKAVIETVSQEAKASFYRVASLLDRLESDYDLFYTHAMQYLGCVPGMESIPVGEKIELSHDLAISALLGQTYNLGELLMHPILDALGAGKYGWLKGLVQAVNAGDHDSFEMCLGFIQEHPALSGSEPFLREKLVLLSLVNLASTKHLLTFIEIANATRSPSDIPQLVIKAQSKKLLRARIDQPSNKVEIEWVQPRVLAQLDGLEQVLLAWQNRIEGAIQMLQQKQESILPLITAF